MWDVIFNPYRNFNRGLTKPSLTTPPVTLVAPFTNMV